MGAAGFLLVLVVEKFAEPASRKDHRPRPRHHHDARRPCDLGGRLAAILLALHLLGLSFWMGALLPLRTMSRDPAAYGGLPALAGLAGAFGRIAGWLVPMLVVAGLAYAAILLGSASAVLTTSYGNLLLVKVGIVGVLLALAARNRWRLVPAIGDGKPAAADRLARSIAWEILAVFGILAATSLMTTSVVPG